MSKNTGQTRTLPANYRLSRVVLGSLSLWEKDNRQDISYILPVIVIGRKNCFLLTF